MFEVVLYEKNQKSFRLETFYLQECNIIFLSNNLFFIYNLWRCNDWSSCSSTSRPFSSSLHLWLYRLISSNEIISCWSQTTFRGSNTVFRPDLHFLCGPLLCCHGDAVSTYYNLSQTLMWPCSPSLLVSLICNVPVRGALMHIFIYDNLRAQPEILAVIIFVVPLWMSSLIASPLSSS